MKKGIFCLSCILLCLSSFISCAFGLSLAHAGKFSNSTPEAPLYVINLDENPRTRWSAVARDYKVNAQATLKLYLGSLPHQLRGLAQKFGENLDHLLPGDYGQELAGIGKSFNISVGDMVLLNVIYDLTAYCTGIIANDMHGGIWHARNLDYGNSAAQTGMLEKITVRVDFHRKGKLLFSGVTFAGYVGVLTGWKPGKFAVTINERDKGSLLENLKILLQEMRTGGKIYPVSMVARSAFENDEDFVTAVDRLATMKLIAPVYYIVSGNSTDEGIVLVRDHYKTIGVNRLNSTAGDWFVVQTNYDPWNAPPKSDDRRDPAIKVMKMMGQQRVSMANLLKVLSMPPVLNRGTIYTSIFSAAYPGKSMTTIRKPKY